MARPDVQTSTLLSAVSFAAGTATSAHNHDIMLQYSVQAVITADTPAQTTFADTAITITGDYIVMTAHGYQTGLKGFFTSSGGLPTLIVTATTYYLIRRDADSFQLATSQALARAGTAITLNKNGSGNHNFKADALANLGVWIEASLDGSTYIPLPSTTITAAGSTMTSYAGVSYNYVRMNSTLTAGQITATIKVRSLGDE